MNMQTNEQAGTDLAIRDEDWVTLREASRAAGVSVSALRKWYRAGDVASRLERGRHGEQRLVSLEQVLERAGRARATSSEEQTADAIGGRVVPFQKWERTLEQLGRVYQMGHELAEARARAETAEAEREFLRERFAELRDRVAEEAGPPFPAPPPRREPERAPLQRWIAPLLAVNALVLVALTAVTLAELLS